jgi:hypothetical protein
VLAHTVARRSNEIGIRLALDATHAAVLWAALAESSGMVALGIAIGVPAAPALTQLRGRQTRGDCAVSNPNRLGVRDDFRNWLLTAA